MFTNEEFKNAIKDIIGERNDDTVLGVLEYLKEIEHPTDHTQEIKELSEKITALEQAKTDTENEWRNKYKEAFFSTPKNPETGNGMQNQYGKEPDQNGLDYENLFTEITD